jgi:putative membrane protein
MFYLWNALVSISAMAFLVWLIFYHEGDPEQARQLSPLPSINATLNTVSALLLCLGYRAIRQKKEKQHRAIMLTAFVVSALFLVCYVTYHSMHGDTKFLGQGWIRPVYFVILISHIVLSMLVFPMILSSIFFGLTDRRRLHRKVAKVTLPVWLYVSVTGVAVFFLLKYHS